MGPRHCRGTATNSWEGGLLGSLDWIFGLLVPGTLIPGIQIPFSLVMKTRTVTQAFDFKHTCGSIGLIFTYSWVFESFLRSLILNILKEVQYASFTCENEYLFQTCGLRNPWGNVSFLLIDSWARRCLLKARAFTQSGEGSFLFLCSWEGTYLIWACGFKQRGGKSALISYTQRH